MSSICLNVEVCLSLIIDHSIRLILKYLKKSLQQCINVTMLYQLIRSEKSLLTQRLSYVKVVQLP